MARTADAIHSLHPFPDGWYLIAPSAHLQAEHLIQKTWMGREVVAWRDSAGAVCVADAYCPHLGACLGPETGGQVCDGRLRCPFHGFEFDIAGRCVATPLGPPPRKARLAAYPVQEVNGFIFAYWDHQGRAPAWQVPDRCPEGWSRRVIKRRRLRTHPQVTTENSVDFGHLSYVHGYRDLKQLSPSRIDGPCLTSSYAFTRHMLTRGLRRVLLPVNIEISVWGLGVSIVEARSPRMGMGALQWVLATPVDGEEIDLWLAVDPQEPARASWYRLVPAWIRRWLVPKILLHELDLDVTKDAKIWSRQRYEPNPVLSKGDHDVYRFRRYSEQFYPLRDFTPAADGHAR